ncbi:hypothetical protein D5086_012102 [Populus alba]|uniref:Uncharacterized protein n=1 Tax=Populus alba TaxID=43335 RepID=A0ACC4C185_POPAL
MESNSMVDVPLKKDIKVSSSDNEKVDEHGVSGVYLNEDGEVETPRIGMVFASQEEDRGIPKSRFQWKQTSKTNCKAKINLVLNPQGQFHICNVVLDHNHELTPGKLHPNICKKSKSFRTRKGREGKEQAGMMLHPDFRSIFGEPLGSETASPDSVMQRSSFSNHLLNGDKHLLCSYTGLPTGETISNRLKRRSPSLEGSQNSQDSLRQALAKRAVALVKSGMVIGLGTGRTLTLVIEEIGKLIQEGKQKRSRKLLISPMFHLHGLLHEIGSQVDLSGVSKIDIAFDGVDEVDFNKNLLKCGGPAHTMQKVIDSVASECIILVDQPKVVHRLGSAFPVPVEVLPPALTPVLKRLATLGGVPEIRFTSNENGPLFTDLGNMVVDVSFPNGIQNPAELEKNIKLLPGVVENGIVTGVATTVLVAVKERGAVNVVNLEDYIKGSENIYHRWMEYELILKSSFECRCCGGAMMRYQERTDKESKVLLMLYGWQTAAADAGRTASAVSRIVGS